MSRLSAHALLALYMLLFPSPIHAQAATASADARILADIRNSEQGSYIDISVYSGSGPINAVDLRLDYDSSKNEIMRIDLTGSFCQIFIHAGYSNEQGKADIVCGLPTPGLSGTAKLARIYFENEDTTDNFNISSESQVLANDGFGTPVLDEIIKSYSR